MRITRVYEPQTLSTGAVLELSETNASHLGRVLRLPAGAEIAVFDGQGHECAARLMFEGRKALTMVKPTMAASLIKLVGFGFNFTAAELGFLLLGCLVSFGLSIVAIRFLMGYIKQHDFKVFGYYRIVLGGLVLLVAFVQWLFG